MRVAGARALWPRRLDLRRIFVHDLPLKAAAVLIAILFAIANAQTDAVVVVVSEETQGISVASNGRMIGGLDEERLRRVLLSLLRSRIQPLPFRSKAS